MRQEGADPPGRGRCRKARVRVYVARLARHHGRSCKRKPICQTDFSHPGPWCARRGSLRDQRLRALRGQRGFFCFRPFFSPRARTGNRRHDSLVPPGNYRLRESAPRPLLAPCRREPAASTSRRKILHTMPLLPGPAAQPTAPGRSRAMDPLSTTRHVTTAQPCPPMPGAPDRCT